MKEYDRQSVLNFVSGKGSVMTEKDVKKMQDEISVEKPSIGAVFVLLGLLTVTNAIQWEDQTIRLLFLIQLACAVIWLLMSKYWLKLSISERMSTDSKFRLLLSFAMFVIIELMVVGGFRILDSDLNLIIPAGMFLLQICCSFAYERMRIIRAIEKNNGILKRPFENMKSPSEGAGIIIVTAFTVLALNGHLTMLTVAVIIVGTFTTITFSRAITMHIYAIYFAKKYGFETELFKCIKND